MFICDTCGTQDRTVARYFDASYAERGTWCPDHVRPDTTTLDGFLDCYTGDREVMEFDLDLAPDKSPFIVIRYGEHVMVLNPMALSDHLCLDVHPFHKGRDATAGVFGMSNGARYTFEKTGTTSHKWPSTGLVAVLLGEQAVTE
jgi:hypothetical protein